MTTYLAKPRSIKDIRDLATVIRASIRADSTEKFPILEFLEKVMCVFDEDFHIEVVDKSIMGDIHGLACIDEHCIKIREDVYNRAYLGCGRDRFTLAHELGHYLLHDARSISLARLGETKNVQAYRNPEWQADTFAAELLMPVELITTDDTEWISNTFGVSKQAAQIRLKKINMH